MSKSILSKSLQKTNRSKRSLRIINLTRLTYALPTVFYQCQNIIILIPKTSMNFIVTSILYMAHGLNYGTKAMQVYGRTFVNLHGKSSLEIPTIQKCGRECPTGLSFTDARPKTFIRIQSCENTLHAMLSIRQSRDHVR